MPGKKKIIIAFLLIYFFSRLTFGQDSRGLALFIKNNRVATYDSLLEKYIYSSPDKALELSYTLLEKQSSSINDLGKAQIYSNLCRIYHLIHDPYNALYFGYRAMLIYKLYNQDRKYLNELNKVSCIYREENIYDNFILSFLSKAIKKYNNRYKGLIILSMANHSLLSKISNQPIIYPIDSLFNETANIKNTKLKVTIYITLGRYYLETQQFSKAIATLKKAMYITKNPHRRLRLNIYLAQFYIKQRNIAGADEVLDNLYPQIKSTKDILALSTWYYLKALIKTQQDKNNIALQYAQKGLQLAIQYNILGTQAKLYKILSEIYMSEKMPDLAFMSFNNYMQTKDSIHSLSKYYNLYTIIKKLSSLDITRENLLLKQQAEYENLKNRQQRLITIILGLIVLFLILISTFAFYLFRTSYKSEQRLKRFAKISLEAILIIVDGHIVEYNDKFIQLTGFSDNDVPSLKLSDILDPVLASKIIETKSILNFETYIKRKVGTKFKAEILSRDFKYHNRKTVKVITIRDVSDFYNTQKELIESQIKFKTLIDTSPDGVLITDTSQKITFISQAAKKILEAEHIDNIVNQDINKILNIKDKIKLLLFTKSDKPIEFIYNYNKTSTIKYLDTKLSIVKSVEGEPIFTFIIIRDVTQKVQIQEALKQSEQKFRELYNRATDGILIIDAQGTIIDANPASENIFGLNPRFLLNQNMENFLPETFASPLQFKEFINAKEKIETPIIQANGDTIYTQISVSKLRLAPEHYLLIIRDITEILQSQEKLRKYAEKLEISNNAKAKLFSIVSHDLRGPIGNLKSMFELILENPNSFNTEELTEILTELKNSSIRTYELLENLLYWSKSQLNQIEYNPQKFNLHIAVEQTINILKQVAKQKDIKLIDTIDKNSCFVKADIEMVKIILRNLITNAIKFTPRGGNITLLNFEDQDNIIVGVKDNGVGIPHDKLVKIFDNDSFFTSYGTENEKGTGLGLQIVKEFVSKNKGRLWVESKTGHGSTFYFTLKKANS